MATTKFDYPTQLLRNPVIDIRSFGCKCDGVTDDVTNFQAAINSAGITSPTGSATVQVPRGRTAVSTALRMPRAGIIIQGWGMMGNGGESGFGGSDPVCSTIVPTSGHDNTPMLSMDPAFYGGSSPQFLRGSCLRDISFDVSGSTRFTAGTPPVVLNLIEVSNCPEFVNIFVYGSIGTMLYIGPNSGFSGNPLSENLVFRNCYFFGGFTGNSAQAVANGVIVQASDNIRFEGGFISYTGPTMTVNNNATDIAGIQFLPGIASSGGGINNISNGCSMNGTAFTNYAVAVRLSNVDIAGSCRCPRYARFTGLLVENYNKVFAFNQEATSFTPGFDRSYVYIFGTVFGGTTFGAGQHILLGSKLLGGYVHFNYQNFAGDFSLDSTCTGVEYHISANPNTGVFYDATDAGFNDGNYQKSGLAGRLLTGQTRFMGTTAPSTANAGSGDCSAQFYGDTVKLFSNLRTIANSSATGFPGEVCQMISGGTNYLVIYFTGIGWCRVAMSTF